MKSLSSAPNTGTAASSRLTATRSRNGCQQCRKRKKKCNEQRPRCLECATRNLACNWYREPRRPQSARRQSRPNKDFALPQAMRLLVTVFATPTPPIQEKLLSHFNSNCPRWLTSVGDAAGSAKLVIPIALRNPVVLDCILSLAAGDLSKYQPASSEMRSLTCGFYGQAVTGIRSAINDQISSSQSRKSPPCSGDVLLAIVLLCVHETVNFSAPDRVFPHLNAAAALCHSHCDGNTVLGTHLRGLLFEVLYYIFTLTAFSHGHRLPLNLASGIFASPLLSEDHCKGVLLGKRCRQIFRVILQVSKLKVGRSSSFASELEVFEARLNNYPKSQAQGAGYDCIDEATSELYRLTCLIYIKKTLEPKLPDSSIAIQGLLEEFIVTLETLPSTSPANNILCWPLFVAGISSVAPSHQRLIVGRLRGNYNSWWRSDILSKMADFLTRNWRQSTAVQSESTSSGDVKGSVWIDLARPAYELPFLLL